MPTAAAASAPARLTPRPFGRTGLTVSPLGLSAFSFGPHGLPQRGARLGPADAERAFYEHGITTFFVSPLMAGLIEGLQRLIRAGHRDELCIVSGGGIPTGWGVRRACEKLLRTLGTDRLDVWLMGWVRARWHVGGKTWPTMRRLKEEGKARAIGFSCHDRPLALALGRELAVDVMMLRYNAAHRGVEREVFAQLGPDRPAIISYTATRWGNLLQPLPQKGFPRGMTGPECYRFVLANPCVDVALCAATTPAELGEDVAGVLAGPLDPARLEEVRRFGDAVHAAARGGVRWMFRQG
jgi:aryl-alcohol dehydrogenase-like predicted oxidoreductase